jgi:hypothetical protein
MATKKPDPPMKAAEEEVGKLYEELENLTAYLQDNRAAVDRFNTLMTNDVQKLLFDGIRAQRRAIALVMSQLQVEFGDGDEG